MECIQYTVRGVPGYVDTGLRAYAQERAQSLNSALVDLLTESLGLLKRKSRNDELAKLAGSWVDDPAMEAAFAEMDRVDEALWK